MTTLATAVVAGQAGGSSMGIRRDFTLHDVTLQETPFRPEGGFDTVVHGYDRTEVDRYAVRVERALIELAARYRRSQAREHELAGQVAALKAEMIAETRKRSLQLPPTQWLAGRMEQMFSMAERAAAEMTEQAATDAEETRATAQRDAEEVRGSAERQAAEDRAAASRDAAATRSEAQREADATRNAARTDAEQARASAQRDAEQTLATAREHAEATVTEASTRAEVIVAEATNRAEVIVAEANARATQLTEAEEQRAARLAALRHRVQHEILGIRQAIDRLAGSDADEVPAEQPSPAAAAAEQDQAAAAVPPGRDSHWQITNPPRSTPRPRDSRDRPQHAESA